MESETRAALNAMALTIAMTIHELDASSRLSKIALLRSLDRVAGNIERSPSTVLNEISAAMLRQSLRQPILIRATASRGILLSFLAVILPRLRAKPR